jgi:tripartite-type tricarboxylate transporter receptor subunit TctC
MFARASCSHSPSTAQSAPQRCQIAGLVDADYPNWFGVFLPAKTPRDVVHKLHRETLKAPQAPKVESKLATLGIDPMVMTFIRV